MEFSWTIFGHSKAVNFLQDSIKNNRLVDAYLFLGPAQVGKTLVARTFVSSLFCVGTNKNCKKCFQCQALERGAHPDFVLVEKPEDKKNISIEQIREVIGKLNKRPVVSTNQVALITSADKMTPEASNALLKTLEEPRAKAKIILLADNDSLLPTIKSRCQVIKFQAVEQAEAIKFLRSLKKEELTEEAIADISRISQGKIGLAHRLAHGDWSKFKEKLLVELQTGQEPIGERFKSAEAANEDMSVHEEKLNLWQIILSETLRKKSGLKHKLSFLEYELDTYTKKSWSEIGKLGLLLQTMPAQIRHNVNTRLIWENFFLNL